MDKNRKLTKLQQEIVAALRVGDLLVSASLPDIGNPYHLHVARTRFKTVSVSGLWQRNLLMRAHPYPEPHAWYEHFWKLKEGV